MTLFARPDNKSPHEWTSLAVRLLKSAPQSMAVLQTIIGRANPSSWSGSFSAKLESRAKLLEKLDVDSSVELQQAKEAARAKFVKEAEAERRAETEEE